MQLHKQSGPLVDPLKAQETRQSMQQQARLPQFLSPRLILTENQGTPFDAETLALSEQITQLLPATNKKRKGSLRPIVLVAMVLVGVLVFIWYPRTSQSASPAITQQDFSSTIHAPGAAGTGKTSGSVTGGQVQVYIVGAVKHPGIYKMAASARLYELLQAAGGPLPDADLLTLDLAAKLTDGQEIYVTRRGEIPPPGIAGDLSPTANGSTMAGASADSPVNINTASATDLQRQLHIARTTAQNIVNYRVQHGDYTSVDQLLQVVRKTTYNKIKDMVTV